MTRYTRPVPLVQAFGIQYIIIVREPRRFETTAARAMKFWLQVALGPPITTPWKQIRKSGTGKTGFSGTFFFHFFSLLRTCWDLRVTPWRFPYHLIRIWTGKSGFFENPDLSFFRLFKLKDPAIWVSMDSSGPT